MVPPALILIEKLTKKETAQYEHETVKIGNEDHYLNCSSAEADVALCIKGRWNPLTGDVELYHYEESAFPGNAAMLDKYLSWKTRGGEAYAPVATK